MALDNGYEMKMFTEYLGQTCLNIFHFELTAGSGNATDLANAWVLQKLPSIKACSSVDVTFKRLETKSILIPTIFDVRALSGTGNQTGSNLGPHDAWSFKYTSARTDAKDGGKRFTGVSETFQDGGLPTPVQSLILQGVEAELETTVDGVLSTYRPRIRGVRRGVLGEFLNAITDVTFIGQYTQNTRKRNTRGIF